MSSGDRFPRASRLARGYDASPVDMFLDGVELSWRTGDARVTAAEIRRAGFPLVHGGYDVESVDRHLDLLEQRALEMEDSDRDLSSEVDASRPGRLPAALSVLTTGASPGGRFPRVHLLRRGYSPREVDKFLNELVPAVRDGGISALPPLDVSSVRESVFHGRWGGYDETCVDDALDEVVDILLRRAASRRTATGGGS